MSTFCHSIPALLLAQAILLNVISGRHLRVLHMVKVTLWSQLRELCKEPVTVFEETILMDCVEIVPVFICPAVVLLCKETKVSVVLIQRCQKAGHMMEAVSQS